MILTTSIHMMNTIRCYLSATGSVKGPQMCSMSAGFLKTETMTTQFNIHRTASLLALMHNYPLAIIKYKTMRILRIAL